MRAEPHLFQRWVHAHEEDTPDTRVYRPAGFPLPPSRGRLGFELRADGTFTKIGIGSTDRPQEQAGRWSFAGEDRVLLHSGDDAQQELQIRSVDTDRLVVERRKG